MSMWKMSIRWRSFWRGAVRRRRTLAAAAAGAVALVVGVILCVSHFACSWEPRGDGTSLEEVHLAHPRVLVEKGAHRLRLFDGDRLVKTYRAAVGGGRADKVKEGDRCTPEGEFFVCYKNPESKYTLSLGLSYPNEEDAARGLAGGLLTRGQHDAIVDACRRRSFDANVWEALWKTPLGGEIMIHGKGSGRDWTLGCVALDDDAIRELYRVLDYGTPVRIAP